MVGTTFGDAKMDFVTSGEIAQQVNSDRDSVAYALRKLRAEPIRRAGIVRLFPASVTEEVRDYLANRKPRKERVS